MSPFRSLHNKGYWSATTSVLLIAVLIALFLGTYYLGLATARIRMQTSDKIDVFVVGQLSRDRLLYCFGEHLEGLAGECSIGGIAGYDISYEDYGACSSRVLRQQGQTDSDYKLVYFVPAFDAGTGLVCLGKIAIYI